MSERSALRPSANSHEGRPIVQSSSLASGTLAASNWTTGAFQGDPKVMANKQSPCGTSASRSVTAATDGSDPLAPSAWPARDRGTLPGGLPATGRDESYLVDPASSHMLVSKIKPCMSKYKLLYCETANGSLNQLSSI